ncbi:hypothetical protein [Haloplanus salilacus]|uniref:hypothetical protein n=1 Tax=Haloplanus salilacus TaxID=2949994 RepID=UPI0030D0AC07
MGVEGFVCWAARSVDDPTELRHIVDAQLPSHEEAVAETERAGLLDGATLRPRGLAAAHGFAEDGGLPMSGATDAIGDFSDILDGLRSAERRRETFVVDAVPEGFEPTEPTANQYDRNYHTVNVARTYPSGASVELNYRSRDPSHPGESRPRESSAILWLRGYVSRTHEYRASWTER